MPASQVMHKWKTGALHSGGPKGPVVHDRSQAIAIMLSEKHKEAANGGKYPERRFGGVVRHFDTGGAATDPVQAVIGALQQGVGTGAGATLNSPSTPAASTTTSAAAPASAGQVAQNTSPAPAVTTPAAGIAPATSIPSSLIPMMSTGTSPALNTNASAAMTGAAASNPAVNPAATAPMGIAPANPLAPSTSAATAPMQNGAGVPAPSLSAATAPSSGVVALPINSAASLNRGGVANRAYGGGFNMSQGPNLNPPWFERSEARNLHVGPVLSAVPGRTDNHQVKVPAGSYVLPAAHVSSMGQGNTISGMSVASKMFSGPYGAAAPKMGHGSGLPHPPKPFTNFANGGYSEGGARGTGHYEPVDVNVSGGEYIVPPWAIIRKYGSLKRGHAIMDRWVMHRRKKEIETQKRLPPPATK